MDQDPAAVMAGRDPQLDKAIEVLSTAPLLAKALRRIHMGDSVSSLFM